MAHPLPQPSPSPRPSTDPSPPPSQPHEQPSPTPQPTPEPSAPLKAGGAGATGASGGGPSRVPAPPGGTSATEGYSGIDPARMDAFERALGRAEDALGRNEQVIRGVLQRLDLDTSGLSALREARSWIESSRPDLRRRGDTIRSERSEWGASAGPIALAAFNESQYGKAGGDPDVYAALGALARGRDTGEVDKEALAALEKRTGDSAFATALMNAMGATAYRKLMADTAERRDDKEAKRLQTALAKMLGTASSRLSDTWRDELTTDLGVGWREGHAVALALKQGTFATGFLLAAARKLDAWDRNVSKAPTGQDPGVMTALMEALSRDPVAAQDFFAGDPTTLKRLLTERGMADKGVALGKALEAATLTFRDHDGSPQNPSRGYLSAKLASELVHIEAGRIEKGYPPASFIHPPSTGRILAGYIADIDRAAQKSDRAVPGAAGADNPGAPGPDPWGAKFDQQEVRWVAREAFADVDAFTPVLMAQTVFTGRLLDHAATQIAAGQGDGMLKTNAQRVGAGFGLITDAAGLAKIDEGKALDEVQQLKMKVFTGVVNTALAIPQSGKWPIIAGSAGAWTGLIEDAFKSDGGAETKARRQANAAVEQTRTLVHDLTAQAMLNHGLFGSADPPAPTHPWASLEGLRDGGDPRDNPNNFLKDDGRTLMTKEEMIDKTTNNSTEKTRRLDAYDRWLYEGPSGDLWRDVELRLNQSFSDGFAQYS
ncbi:hypothetical protein [Microtetraspora malaysiensis]|uniref:hypothetical protein n=1 Tax=Microtetraspora malaysiensis TaxID=161358 RepID=UPI000B1F9AD3|nr:hypothetical protein [Microtetraspora malaysiensis]